MLEGEAQEGNSMERRPTSGLACKGNGSEFKKDNGTVNRNQRHSKRRDNNPRPRNDQAAPRKPLPQRSRAMDKRPRPRGCNKNTEEDEMTKDEEQNPEFGSVQAWGSKKSNMSHLLNFHFEQRDLQKGRGGPGRGQPMNMWRGNRKRWESRTMPYNKERFLQANCQFVVCESGDYSVHSANPDTLVDWIFIEQVRILSTDVPSCPICLYPPTAAKITRCGHIYCWTCILHYLSLGEKTWRKCPICYESVHEKDLKSVKALETRKYKADDVIEMKLMKREKGTTIVIPMDKWQKRDDLFNIDDDSLCTCYSKLLIISPEQVGEMLKMEKSELEEKLLEEESGTDSLEVSYIKAAMDAVDKRQAELFPTVQAKEEIAGIMGNLELGEGAVSEDESLKYKNHQHAVLYADAFDDMAEKEEPQGVEKEPQGDEEEPQIGSMPTIDSSASLSSLVCYGSENEGPEFEDAKQDPDPPLERTESPEHLDLEFPVVMEEKPSVASAAPRNTNAFYFYQANDGQQIYLNSLNARCLVKEYGSLELCPPTLTAKIVDIEMVSMNEELRGRLRYLNHLPLTCEFQVAELELQQPILSKETLDYFSEDFDRRRKMRQRKMREDKRRSNKIQQEENKKFGIDPTVRIVKSSLSEPDFGKLVQEAAPVHTPYLPDTAESTPVGSPMEMCVGSPVSVGSSDDGQLNTMSFAQMLKAGKSRAPEVWPKNEQASREAGGPGAQKAKDGEGGSDNEDRVPIPVYQTSFGDAIQAALDSYSKGDENVFASVTIPEAMGSSGSGKKKKKQKKLLFTTTMARAK